MLLKNTARILCTTDFLVETVVQMATIVFTGVQFCSNFWQSRRLLQPCMNSFGVSNLANLPKIDFRINTSF